MIGGFKRGKTLLKLESIATTFFLLYPMIYRLQITLAQPYIVFIAGVIEDIEIEALMLKPEYSGYD
jgi:hypothetical protein